MSAKKAAVKQSGKKQGIVYEDPELAAMTREREEQAEKRREEAFQAEPEWNGQPLVWSISKESLFYALRQANGARELADVLQDIDAFFADAIRIIYLSLHGPEDWRAWRSDLVLWQEKIEAWADANITRAQRVAAVMCGWKVLELAWENRHEVAVDPARKGQALEK